MPRSDWSRCRRPGGAAAELGEPSAEMERSAGAWELKKNFWCADLLFKEKI